ncbi:hypothetical protein H6G20_11425 [Desertifilum sp. FACHB-1129]|uniref:Uncharacterized protein n=2 Tax=Desertifilum tharense IPPAS B-1220 TaxID=1781255 RepID=A0A1E5QQW5_9CYAN|nr:MULTISPECIES: hypothetical protein [Desertifilum]MDA0210788.1 hypothetical protein [Cyanobacteria bacterium FC1]MBD2312274.1 hypothetical protein [Desertifilum sp. FACHB-1129]MBD2323659.1 hypothetical protein [Desertifilum sp. FACHB-866]MBD2332356.1 hypothetical protein [Desertifilum sp. FACHB-868]OEJ77050.1 hypothetical protein BH720_01035 [Desertifilum tharense IPPAS B-1220]
MSEYQYYEFQAIDRPLTANEQAEIRKLSSRVQPTPTQAVFVYNYGDFRGNPEEILATYPRSTPQATPGFRRLSELTAIADRLSKEREDREQQALKKQRIEQLEALALKETETWETVGELIRLKQSQAYDRAVTFLQDLRDLADYQGQLPQFIQRLEKLKSEYHNRPALLARLKKIER